MERPAHFHFPSTSGETQAGGQEGDFLLLTHTGGIWGTCQKCSSSYSLIQSTAGQCYTKPGSDFLSTCPGNPHCQAGHSGDKKDFQSPYGSFLYHKGLTKLSPGDDWQPELIHVTKCTLELGCDAEREYFQVLKRQLFQ